MQFCCGTGRGNWYGDDELPDLFPLQRLDSRLYRSTGSNAVIDENNGFAPKVRELLSAAVQLLPAGDLPALSCGLAAQIFLRDARR